MVCAAAPQAGQKLAAFGNRAPHSQRGECCLLTNPAAREVINHFSIVAIINLFSTKSRDQYHRTEVGGSFKFSLQGKHSPLGGRDLKLGDSLGLFAQSLP